MSMTDPIADLLTRIRNAHLAKHDRLDVPFSKLKLEVCRVLKEEGFIRNFRLLETDGPSNSVRVFLRYAPDGTPAIRNVLRVSKPGRRVYRGADDIQPVRNGLGSGHPLHVTGAADRSPGARAPGRRRAALRALVGR